MNQVTTVFNAMKVSCKEMCSLGKVGFDRYLILLDKAEKHPTERNRANLFRCGVAN